MLDSESFYDWSEYMKSKSIVKNSRNNPLWLVEIGLMEKAKTEKAAKAAQAKIAQEKAIQQKAIQ